MSVDPGPYDLAQTRLVLAPDGVATPKAVTPDFYDQLGTAFGSFAGHMLVAEHAFDAPWPSWEIHPFGDELVYFLEGDIDLVLWVGGAEAPVRLNRPGSYVVVPKAIWHTGRPRQPSRLLFVTPGQGTRNAERPET